MSKAFTKETDAADDLDDLEGASPIPAGDRHLEAINRNYLPVLERLRASGEFVLEPSSPADPALLIYRRRPAGGLR